MRINTNLSALNTQGRLNAAQTGMSKSLEKLSSGLRIGRASDDAAGLAISEKMRGQIKGLDRAGKNATEAISLIQTAEGALNESHSILQRMRELAGQAASDTATASDRNEMQKEVDALAKELTRITNTTQFNTKNLLGGSFTNQKFQIGANTGQDIDLSIGAMDAFSLGVTAAKGVTIADGTSISSATLGASASAATGRYSIEGTVATAGNKSTGTMGKAAANAGTALSIGGGTGITVTSTGGYGAFQVVNDGSAPTFSWDAATKTVTLRTNGTADGTAVTAAWNTWAGSDATAAKAVMTVAAEGSGAGAVDTFAKAAITNSTDKAQIDLTSVSSGTTAYSLAFTNTGAAGAAPSVSINGTSITVNLSSTGNKIDDVITAINSDSVVGSLVQASLSSGTTSGSFINGAVAAAAQTAGTDSTANFTLKDGDGKTLQTLANQALGTVTFNNGISATTNTSAIDKLAAGAAIASTKLDVVANNSTAAQAAGNGVIAADATVDKGILINTQANASSAITAIDNAINTVSSARSNLGAIQNRLEHTINNLGVTQENMTAAESNIRDVDMAKEMSDFTKNQILSQAATAMLAQANQVPQGVLKLLG